jgi:competence protein ComEC
MIKFLISILIFFILTSSAFCQVFEAHFINVGYGDAILLELPFGGTILLGAGCKKYEQKIVKYVKNHGIKNLDIVVATG